MTDRESDIRFVTVPPGAGLKSRAAGVSQAPPEERYGWPTEGESNHEGDPPAAAYNANGGQPDAALEFLPAEEFMRAEFELPEALIGEPNDTLLCAGSTLMVYGQGGAGKTTLSLDAMCHLASGTPWLGQPVVAPVKIILIENEGPRVNLQQRMITRRDAWEGEPWWPNVDVLFNPWHGFSFRTDWQRQSLADRITDFEADLVIVGPLVTVGAVGAGTPEDVNRFEDLLENTRQRTPLDPAFWIVHHENKAGAVSGAWDRLPDTMLHVKPHDNGHTGLEIEKARWSSALQGTTLNLSWNGTYSFTVDAERQTTENDDITTRIRELFEHEDRWRSTSDVRETVQGNKPAVTRSLEHLAQTGYLTELRGDQLPDAGYQWNARCWCHDPSSMPMTGIQGETQDRSLDQALDHPHRSSPVQRGPAHDTRAEGDSAGPPPTARKGGRRSSTFDPPTAQPPTAHQEPDEPLPGDDFPF